MTYQPMAPQVATPPPDGRVYVGSLHYDLKEADIRALFSPFWKHKELHYVS